MDNYHTHIHAARCFGNYIIVSSFSYQRQPFFLHSHTSIFLHCRKFSILFMKSWATSIFSLKKRKGSISKATSVWHWTAVLLELILLQRQRDCITAQFQVLHNTSSILVRTFMLTPKYTKKQLIIQGSLKWAGLSLKWAGNIQTFWKASWMVTWNLCFSVHFPFGVNSASKPKHEIKGSFISVRTFLYSVLSKMTSTNSHWNQISIYTWGFLSLEPYLYALVSCRGPAALEVLL